MTTALRSVGVWGTGSAVPERVLTNADLEKMVETSDEWIRTRTGIRERRIAGPETATSDLAYEAGRKALEQAGLAPEDLELIIVATVTPDTAFPSVACLLQDRLGAPKAAALDVSAACSGLIYGLDLAVSSIASGRYNNALVIGAETLSRITDWTDRSTCVLFGDGAGALVLGPVSQGEGVLATYLGADGSGGPLLCLPGGGSRHPVTEQTIASRMHYIKMNGNEVFRFAVRIMSEASEEVLRRAGLTTEEVSLLIPHQANVRIIDAVAKRLQLPSEKVYVNVDRYGNTSAASIGIALDEANRSGRLRPGDTLVVVAFGGGLTWGSAAIRWAGTGRGVERGTETESEGASERRAARSGVGGA